VSLRLPADLLEAEDQAQQALLEALAEPKHVTDGGDQILRPERHLRLGHVEAEFAIDPKSADPAEPIAIGIAELLVE